MENELQNICGNPIGRRRREAVRIERLQRFVLRPRIARARVSFADPHVLRLLRVRLLSGRQGCAGDGHRRRAEKPSARENSTHSAQSVRQAGKLIVRHENLLC
jgi:hypothetical protein